MLIDVIRGRQNAGSRGRSLREAAGLSQAELASEIGISEATLSRWENGHSKPRQGSAARYQHALEEIEQELGHAS
jgi:transcriptional regulator with XRE-family HTH domain